MFDCCRRTSALFPEKQTKSHSCEADMLKRKLSLSMEEFEKEEEAVAR